MSESNAFTTKYPTCPHPPVTSATSWSIPRQRKEGKVSTRLDLDMIRKTEDAKSDTRKRFIQDGRATGSASPDDSSGSLIDLICIQRK